MNIPGRESISKLFRMTKRSLGLPKRNLTVKEKREFIQTCERLAALADQLYDLDSMTVLETGLTYLVSHVDRKTRDGLFTVVNLAADAQQEVEQRCLITPVMINQLNSNKDNVQAGVVAKNVVDLLVDYTSKDQINATAKDQIFKSVVLRLALELSHNALTDVAAQITPMKDKKWKNTSRDMYG